MNEDALKLMRPRTWTAALFVAAILALSACSDKVADPQTESVLNRGNGDEPESLDVHKSASVEAGDVQRDLGEGLFGFDPKGARVAAAARRWEVSADGLEYRFFLRPEARWSNGDALTAADFVYSFRRLVDPATAALNTSSLNAVENAEEIIAGSLPSTDLGVEAVGAHELRVRLRRPVPYFLTLLTHPSTFPVHPPSVEAFGDAHTRAGNLVSNGAYRLVDWQFGAFIELERNEYYWDNAATAIDRVRHFVTPEPMAELNRFRAGELHITRTIPPGSFKQMQQQRPAEVRTSPSLGVYYYGFNLTNPDLAGNAKLRQALSMAIDREVIANDVIGRGEAPAYGWVPDGTDGYESRKFAYADMPATQRHRIAQQLLQEAGYGADNKPPLELRYNTSATHQRIAVAIQSMWRDVLGMEVTLVNEDFQVLLANIQQMQVTEIFRLGWTGNYNDPHAFLSILESSDPSNLVAYKSEKFDDLMKRAAEQTDPQLRMAFLGEAETLMLADHPLIPIYFNVNKSMVSSALNGWGDNVLNYHYSRHFSLDTVN